MPIMTVERSGYMSLMLHKPSIQTLVHDIAVLSEQPRDVQLKSRGAV